MSDYIVRQVYKGTRSDTHHATALDALLDAVQGMEYVDDLTVLDIRRGDVVVFDHTDLGRAWWDYSAMLDKHDNAWHDWEAKAQAFDRGRAID